MPKLELTASFSTSALRRWYHLALVWAEPLLFLVLAVLSVWLFNYYYNID